MLFSITTPFAKGIDVRHVLRRNVVGPQAVEEDDVPQEAAPPPGSRLADVAKAAALKAERAIIEDTLRQVHWNRRRAAEQLGVSYKTLLNKIKECGISRK